jgi:hypothetical protein
MGSVEDFELEINSTFGSEDAITSLVELCCLREDDTEILIDVLGWVSTSTSLAAQ